MRLLPVRRFWLPVVPAVGVVLLLFRLERPMAPLLPARGEPAPRARLVVKAARLSAPPAV